MAKELVQARVEAIRRLVRRRMARPLARALEKSSPRDIVDACAHLTTEQFLFLMEHIPDGVAGGRGGAKQATASFFTGASPRHERAHPKHSDSIASTVPNRGAFSAWGAAL